MKTGGKAGSQNGTRYKRKPTFKLKQKTQKDKKKWHTNIWRHSTVKVHIHVSELFSLVFELWCHYSSSNVQLLFLWKYLTSCSCLFIYCSSIYVFKCVTSYFDFSIFSHFSSYVIVFLSMVPALCLSTLLSCSLVSHVLRPQTDLCLVPPTNDASWRSKETDIPQKIFIVLWNVNAGTLSYLLVWDVIFMQCCQHNVCTYHKITTDLCEPLSVGVKDGWLTI